MMNKLDVIKAWKKDHVPETCFGNMTRGEPVRILPGYRLDFGDSAQLRLNFDGVEIQDTNPSLVVMYRRWAIK